MAIKKGDIVSVHYTGTLEDGSVFDSSMDREEPLEFEVGSGKIIKGFDNAVIDMSKGEEKDIKLTPSDAYGDSNPALIQPVPRDKLPKEQEPKEGMMLIMQHPNGSQIPVKIAKVTPDTVTIDLNHPLAGKTLNFKIKVVDVKECSKLEAGSAKQEEGGQGLEDMAGFKGEEKPKKPKRDKKK